jgi:hypothetical protein
MNTLIKVLNSIGAAAEVDRALRVCLGGGFRSILLRGDTDFSQTSHLDRWASDPRVQFIFGMDATAKLHLLADDLPADAWQPLERPARYQVQTSPRQRPQRVKEKIVQERAFKNIRLEGEEVAAFAYRPWACKKTYRMVVVRKNLAVEKGEQRLFDDYRYFFYLTNDGENTPAEIVFRANDRCNQGGPVAGSIDQTEHLPGVAQRYHQGMVAPSAIIGDVHTGFAFAGGRHQGTIEVNQRLLEERRRLPRPEALANLVERRNRSTTRPTVVWCTFSTSAVCRLERPWITLRIIKYRSRGPAFRH